MAKTLQAKYSNAKTEDSSANMGQILWRMLTQKVADKIPPVTLPVQKPDLLGSHDILVKISHSTVLLRLDGQYVLTDPVFSKRASPVQFVGPKRFHDLPLTIAELPHLAVVLISHDHYDHLDKTSIKALAAKTSMFVVPTGVDQHLRRFGIMADKIVVLDWWQHCTLGSLTFHATPAQHFSGRGLFDKNNTTWASFVIESVKRRIFFSGDSGYFNGFAEIGKRFGGFDLSMIETGAYDEMWPDIHMQPEQS
uniref:MBL fold metallo-hydrolase n=1 Tax=Paraglaciecola sp. TaxID=1920173 RepID=UPI0030F49510